ncbi:ATP-binding protein, partial [Longivirga aurantiaca]
MDPLRNPYTPNAGARPPVILGRDDQLQTFALLLARMAAGRTEQSMIITGLRGVGKTVLLGSFRTEALGQSWVVIDSEVSKHSDDAFRRDLVSDFRTALFELSPKARWSDRLKRAASVLRSFSISVDPSGSLTAGVDVAALEGQADSGNLHRDLSDLFVAIGEAAQEQGRGVVLLYDEVQFLTQPQLEALIAALHKTVQRGLPVTLVGAGLPQIAELAGDAKSYAERLFKFPRIGSLSDADASRALADPAESEGATFSPGALHLAVELTEGYPYFIQELGYAVWGVAGGPTITPDDVEAALPLYESKLDS